MTVASEITRISNAKECIRQAIVDKGVSVSCDLTIDCYADCINAISGGVYPYCYILVGGGGGGGGYCCNQCGGGGGGGGAVCVGLGALKTSKSVCITIGSGGAGWNGNKNARSSDGGDSCIGTLIACGGKAPDLSKKIYYHAFGGTSGNGCKGGECSAEVQPNMYNYINAQGGGGGAGGCGCNGVYSRSSYRACGGNGGPGICGFGGGGGGFACDTACSGIGVDGGGCGCPGYCNATNYGGGGGGGCNSYGTGQKGGNGCQGVALISYPTNGNFGYTCATGGDCCYCETKDGIQYKVHRFTSNGTFCVVC